MVQHSKIPHEDKVTGTPHLPRKTSFNLDHMASPFCISWSKISSNHHCLSATGIHVRVDCDGGGKLAWEGMV